MTKLIKLNIEDKELQTIIEALEEYTEYDIEKDMDNEPYISNIITNLRYAWHTGN